MSNTTTVRVRFAKLDSEPALYADGLGRLSYERAVDDYFTVWGPWHEVTALIQRAVDALDLNDARNAL